MVSIATGVMVLILALAVLGGFKEVITQKVYNFDTHLSIEKIEQFKLSNPLSIKNLSLTEIKKHPQVKSFSHYANMLGIIQFNKELEGIVLRGVDSTFDDEKFEKNLIKGRFIQDDAKNEIVISKSLASRLLINVQDTVLFNYLEGKGGVRHRWLNVVGIYQTNLEEIDRKKVIGDIGLVRYFYTGWNADIIEGVGIDIHDVDSIDFYQGKFDQIIDIDMRVDQIERKYYAIFDWLAVINNNVVFLIIIVCIIVFINITSITLVLIMERTRMVGVLKALGASNGLLFSVFLRMMFTIALKGLLLGNAIALVFALLQYHFHLIPMDPANYYMEYVPIKLQWEYVLLVNLLATVFFVLIVMLPITIIERIKPVKAIQFN